MLEPLSSYSDEQLLTLAHQGEDVATDYLLEKYKPLVRKKARTLYLIGGDNDDLIQEGMIALYKAIRAYDTTRESSFLSYATLCIEHQLYNVIKGANRLKNSPLNTYISLDLPMGGDGNDTRETLKDTLVTAELTNPEDIIIDKENVTDIESAFKKHLSSFEQQVVTLYIDGCNYQQIAKELNRTPKSIDNALQRIKNKLSNTNTNKKASF